MNTQTRTARLQHMMQPYEGPVHTVVAMDFHQGTPSYIMSGAQSSGIPEEEQIFEIGSITKVFTGILLCLLIEEGKVDPKAPLRDISQDLEGVPEWITPENLISHTSGLPNIHLPIWKAVLKPQPDGPYARFSRSDLLQWFSHWRGKAPGGRGRHAYSNLGVGLLGEAMAMQAGTGFVDLLAEKVIAPLGLKDTVDQLGEEQQGRFVQPRATNGNPVLPWTFQAMAAAGCLRSSARDLARFSDRVIRALTAPETSLERAICRSMQPIFGLGRGGRMEPAQCWGWISTQPDPAAPRFYYANGGTAGSTCALCICLEKVAGFAILSNNGVAANLWASTKLSWSNPLGQAHDYFTAI